MDDAPTDSKRTMLHPWLLTNQINFYVAFQNHQILEQLKYEKPHKNNLNNKHLETGKLNCSKNVKCVGRKVEGETTKI